MHHRLARPLSRHRLPMGLVVLTLVLFAAVGFESAVALEAESTILVAANSGDAKSTNDRLCTLREAIIAANTDSRSGNKPGECPAGKGSDTIVLPAGTYTLNRTDNGREDSSNTGDLDIAGDLRIVGDGARTTIIDASSITDRVLHVLNGNVTISGVTIVGGRSKLDGGGILNMANLTLVDVVIAGNAVEGSGGGIFNDGSLDIEGSTVSANSSLGNGGGIMNSGVLSVVNSTLSNNRAEGSGGGVFVAADASASFGNATIAANTAGAQAAGLLTTGETTVANSIVANHAGGADCRQTGGVFSSGHTLFEDAGTDACGLAAANPDANGNMVGMTPLLQPLANNGGETNTHALEPGSPAIDSASTTYPPVDQRGVSRPQIGGPDMGAYEMELPAPVVNSSADPGDGVCNLAECTLREALVLANATAFEGGSILITFNIPGDDDIYLTSPLPAIASPVHIDGVSQGTAIVHGQALAGPGLVLNASDSTVEGLTVQGFGGDGVVVNGDNNTLAGNTVSANTGDGVAIQGAPNTVSGNTVSNNGSDGIRLSSGNNTVSGNTVSGNAAFGVVLSGIEGGNTVSANTVTGNGGDASNCAAIGGGGIRIENSTNTISGNTVSQNHGNGVHVASGGANQLLDNDITGNTLSGILVQGDGGNIISGNTIADNGHACAGSGANGDGITIDSANNNVSGNTISANSGNGITVLDVATNTNNGFLGNSIGDNGGLAVDLGGDGLTPNDDGDGDSGANNVQNYPVLFRATPAGNNLVIEGWLNSAPSSSYTIQFFAGAGSSCGQGEQYLLNTTPLAVTTDARGNVYFKTTPQVLPGGLNASQVFVSALATDTPPPGLSGNTSELGSCLPATPDNDSWKRALRIEPGDEFAPVQIEHVLALPGQARWYKFSILPGRKVMVTLTGLEEDYNLTVYKDIEKTYTELLSANALEALTQLGAEFAPDAFSPDAFSPDAFSPDAFSPDAFSPDAFSPDAFSPDAFSPDAFSPDAFSPDAFSPDAFSPDAFSPDAFSPDAFSPDAFSPDAFSPDAFSPDAFSPDAFSAAQSASLIGVSAFQGTAGEGIIVNTWDNSGDFYVRVRGSNGAFNPVESFHLEVSVVGESCAGVAPVLESHSPAALAGNFATLILHNAGRMQGTEVEKGQLLASLNALAANTKVNGAVIDVSTDPRVAAAIAQADAHPDCPYATNLVADAIKRVIDAYRDVNPDLAYLVLVGNDDAIPFFRYPDRAMLANEQNYFPPVKDGTASQASLRLGYVLSQDGYGADGYVNGAVPLPGLAVGRLAETIADVNGSIDAYLQTFVPGAAGNVMNGLLTPQTSLVTGYDFLEDAALAVQSELSAGTNGPVDSLIAAGNLSPQDAGSWSADELRTALLGSGRHDLIFLAGHFSAGSALAADYTTRLLASEVADASVDMRNAVVYSAGCHSGYNIVNEHGVAGITREPDWAQAFARKGAVLIAGTGYQYGDTEFIEYSERLYLAFTRQLRTGQGPVSVGQALVAAKQDYLKGTPALLGIHEKALLEATLFGLPMLEVNMPGTRLAPGADTSVVNSVTAATTDPGLTLGLAYHDVQVIPTLTQINVPLSYVDSNDEILTTYFSGADGILSNPAQPTLPLETRNVSVSNQVLRGVGFRTGSFTDLADITPFTGAPTTEIRGVHAPFVTEVFYPVQPWGANYYETLTNDGPTRLTLTPAQFKSTPPDPLTGTMRTFQAMGFRLFYSNNFETYEQDGFSSTPALSTAPSIVEVSSDIVDVDGDSDLDVTFEITVVGNPAAGMQEVWVTWTDLRHTNPGSWKSIDLTQSSLDSTVWQGSLDITAEGIIDAQQDLRFMVQAVNGVGLVSLATNLGAYYVPGSMALVAEPTALTLDAANPSTGAYGSKVNISANLSAGPGAGCDKLFGRTISFRLGSQTRQGITDCAGHVTVAMPLLGLPGAYDLRVSFAGAGSLLPSEATMAFEITKQATSITVVTDPSDPQLSDGSVLLATLTDAEGRRLSEKTLFVVVRGDGGDYSAAMITDYAGQVRLESIPFSYGSYTVDFYFGTDGEDGDPANDVILLYNTGTAVQEVRQPDSRYLPSRASATIRLNSPPVCEGAYPNPDTIWPLNKAMVPVEILGVTDPDGDVITLVVDGIFQDEPWGYNGNDPDGDGLGTDRAQVRAERDGNGDGRVYHIFFTASDGTESCQGEVLLPTVPHDSSSTSTGYDFDGGACYNSVDGTLNVDPSACSVP